MFWSPRHHALHGIVVVPFDGQYHLFSTQAPVGDDDLRHRTLCHAVSDDLLRWEQVPNDFAVGPPGAFDGYTIYDVYGMKHAELWHLFYTGLDRPHGLGQQQAIGLATSSDLVHWRRHPGNPVLRADPGWYEPMIPREATYQEKDFGRLWFRDPWIFRDPAGGAFHMVVGARNARAPVDLRGCLAWATSADLIRWQPRPPLYSPHRFHTLETPTLFEREGRHYITFLTHPNWGAPFISTDPYQLYGNFYAVSDNGIGGPYRQPDDEVLLASSYVEHGRRRGRGGVFKTVQGYDGELYCLYMFSSRAAEDDSDPFPTLGQVVAPKRVRFTANGQMQIAYNPQIERGATVTELALNDLPAQSPAFRYNAGSVIGKQLTDRASALFPAPDEPGVSNGVYSARIQFGLGWRAGLAFRYRPHDRAGWQIMLDRRYERVEFRLVDRHDFIDARRWKPSATSVELKIVVWGPSIEVYVDDRLMLHQARHREKTGRCGLIVENAEARFEAIQLRHLLPQAGP